MSDSPKSGHGVWHHEYRNGYIQRVDWREGDVYVFFWARTYHIRYREEVFDVSQFDCYDDRFQQWMIF